MILLSLIVLSLIGIKYSLIFYKYRNSRDRADFSHFRDTVMNLKVYSQEYDLPDLTLSKYNNILLCNNL